MKSSQKVAIVRSMETFMEFMTWAAGLPVPIKVIITLIIILASIATIAVLWSSATAEPKKALWPEEMGLDDLTKRIGETSSTNRRLVILILSAGPNGIYAEKLREDANLSRREVTDRCKELTEAGLIVTRNLTDKRYEIHDDLLCQLGPNWKETLRSLLV